MFVLYEDYIFVDLREITRGSLGGGKPGLATNEPAGQLAALPGYKDLLTLFHSSKQLVSAHPREIPVASRQDRVRNQNTPRQVR